MLNYLNSKLNDEALTKVEKIFEEIDRTHLENKRLVKYNDFYMDDKYAEISKILSERFGFGIELENKRYGNVYVYPNVNQYNIDLKNRLKKQLEKKVVKGNLSGKIRQFLYTMDKVEQELRTGLKIDMENMVITSKNDFEFKINIQYEFIRDNGLTPREVVSILLHEIGHIFNGLLLLPNTVANASDLMYNIIGSLEENKNIKEVIMKLSDNPSDGEVTNEVVFNMYKSYIIDRNRYFAGYSSRLTSENSADFFSAKFGYGSDLASGLTKIGDIIIKSDTIKNTVLGVEIMIILGLLIANYGLEMIIGLTIGIVTNIAVLTVFISGTIAFMVWLFSRAFGTGQLRRDESTHEDVKTRVERLKNKVISLAKNSPNKEEAVRAIKEIKALNGILNNISDTLGTRIYKILTSNSEYTVLTLTDKLINNELFIQSLRLKYLKGE